MSATKPRPRHVPQRTCVGCRSTSAKRELIRVVRTPAGQIEPDPTGKKPGRGAYLCSNPQCWDRAIKKGWLQNALATTLTPDGLGHILKFKAERLEDWAS